MGNFDSLSPRPASQVAGREPGWRRRNFPISDDSGTNASFAVSTFLMANQTSQQIYVEAAVWVSAVRVLQQSSRPLARVVR